MIATSALVGVVVLSVAVSTWMIRAAAAASRSAALVAHLGPAPIDPTPPSWFLDALGASGLPARPDRAWQATLWVTGGAAALVAWRWPQVVIAGAAVGLVGVRIRRRTRVRADRRQYDSGLMAVIDSMVSRLATGTSLAVAIEEGAAHPSPAGRDMGDIIVRHRHGQSLQSTLDRWALSRGTPGARLLADALAIAGRSGGSQRDALVGVQATLRDRESLAREVRALSSQARTSGVVLALTPFAFAGVVALVDSDVAAFFSSPAGWACLVVGALLDATGALWMNRLTEAHR